MPRSVRDSDEDVELKGSVRRTRASTAASSTDSPARKNTRSAKQLATIESSPDIEENNVQPKGRTTRSRAATSDKSTATTTAKNSRSRKNSVSSDRSVSVEVESETLQKRVTRKTAVQSAASSISGTPTKTNLRSRSIRAGSEAKSTPPAKSKRVTRASSVDPVGNLSESTGTPVKRRTRASMVPLQPTVSEEQDAKNKAYKSLENSVVEISEDKSEDSSSTPDEKPSKKSSKITKQTEKDVIEGEFVNSEKVVNDESLDSNEIISQLAIKTQSLNPSDNVIESSIIEVDSSLEEDNLKSKIPSEIQNYVKEQDKITILDDQQELETDKHSRRDSISNYGSDYIDVENSLDSHHSDESSIKIDNSKCKISNIPEDCSKLDLKDAYVKLDRTKIVEKFLCEKIDHENDNVTISHLKFDNNNHNTVTMNAKTPIILVNDIVNTNENPSSQNNHEDTNLAQLKLQENSAKLGDDKNDEIELMSVSTNGDDEKMSLMCTDDDDNIEAQKLDDVNVNDIKEQDHEKEINHVEKIDESVESSKTDSNLKDNSSNTFPASKAGDPTGISISLDREVSVVVSRIDDVSTFLNIHNSNNADAENSEPKVNDIKTQKSDGHIQYLPSIENKECKEAVIVTNENIDKIINPFTTSDCTNETIDLSHISNAVLEFSDPNNDSNIEKHSPQPMSQFNDVQNGSSILKHNSDETSNTKIVTESSQFTDTCAIIVENSITSEQDSNVIQTLPCSDKINVDDTAMNSNDDKIKTSIFVNGCDISNAVLTNDAVEIDQKNLEQEHSVNNSNEEVALEPMETDLLTDGNGEVEIFNIPDDTDSDSNQNELEVSTLDKNEISSAVTETDGDSDSSPELEMKTTKTRGKAKGTTKKAPLKKERSIGKLQNNHTSDVSDSEGENAEGLFQDIPAEEWNNEKTPKDLANSDNTDGNKNSSEESVGVLSTNKKESSSVKDDLIETGNISLDEQIENQSANNISNESDNKTAKDHQSPSKRSHKLVEKKEGERSPITISENRESVKDLRKSLNKTRKSVEKALSEEIDFSFNSPSEQKKNESFTGKSSKNQSFNTSHKSALEGNQNVSCEPMEVDEEIVETTNKSLNRSGFNLSNAESVAGNATLLKNDEKTQDSTCNNRKSLDKRNSSEFNQSLNKSKHEKEKLSTSLNSSKKSSRKSLKDKESGNSSASEADMDVLHEKSLNKSSKDRSLRKSLGKSIDISNIVDPDSSDDEKEEEKLDDSDNRKSMNTSSKSHLSFNKSVNLPSIIERYSAEHEEEKSMENKNLNKSNRENSLISPSKTLNKSVHSSNEVNQESPKADGKKGIDRSKLSKSSNDISFNTSSRSVKLPNKSVDISHIVDKDSSDSEIEKADSPKKKLSASRRESSSINSSEMKDKTLEKDAKSEKVELDPEIIESSKSVRRSIELMKSNNPSKLNHSTIAVVDSSSDDDEGDDDNDDDDTDDNDDDDDVNERMPKFILEAEDSDETMDSDDFNEDESSIDSDTAREYNLGGKILKNFDDDDVPGIECRASEQEFSDAEDDGSDLAEFVVPDDEIEECGTDSDEVEDDGEESDNEEEDKDGDEKEDEVVVDDPSQKINNKSDLKNSINISKLSLKDKSANKSLIVQNSESESNNEEEVSDVEYKSNVKIKSLNNSKLSKNKSLNLSKSITANEDLSKSVKDKNPTEEESDQNKITNGIVNKKNKSFNDSTLLQNKKTGLSESLKDNSVQISKSKKNKSMNESINDRGTQLLGSGRKNLSVSKPKVSEDSNDEEIVSESTLKKPSFPASPAPSESGSESGEDSYRIITVKPVDDTHSLIPKGKKLALLPGTSTPKAVFDEKNDKHNISKRKSGSLNDLSHTKNTSKSILSNSKTHDNSVKFSETVEVACSPESILQNRQPWKLIPLNHTAHVATEETPGTKLLKKSKLNDSVPVLKSMKSNDLDESEEAKESTSLKEAIEKYREEKIDGVQKKSKKRKLAETSNIVSLDDDSIMIGKKNKKRARIEESIVQDDDEQGLEEAVKSKKKKKKNKQVISEESIQIEAIEETQKTRKKKKNKDINSEEITENIQDANEEHEKKKKKKKKDLDIKEEDLDAKVIKSKKKKSRLSDEKSDQENINSIVETKKKSKLGSQIEVKKSKKKNEAKVPNYDDDVPECVAFEESKRSALVAMQQATDSNKIQKLLRKKLQKEHVDRMVKQKEGTKEKKSLKRLSIDFLDNLTDEPIGMPAKRQKLNNNKERKILIQPSTSMFSPNKVAPKNLKVDDGYIPLSQAGGTTQFGVVNLEKAKRVTKKNVAALNFREKILSRNFRQPVSAYHTYLQKQKAKGSSASG